MARTNQNLSHLLRSSEKPTSFFFISSQPWQSPPPRSLHEMRRCCPVIDVPERTVTNNVIISALSTFGRGLYFRYSRHMKLRYRMYDIRRYILSCNGHQATSVQYKPVENTESCIVSLYRQLLGNIFNSTHSLIYFSLVASRA